MTDDREIAAVLMELAHTRGANRTFCRSEAARRLDPTNWRALMPEVRRVVAGLRLEVTQKGQLVDIATACGPVRLRLPG